MHVTQKMGSLGPIKASNNADGLIFFPSHDTLLKFEFSDFPYYAIYIAAIPRVLVEKKPPY